MTDNYVPAVLLGSAIGDALGMPFEQLGVKRHPLLNTWNGTFEEGTYHKLPKGHWTDDTEMAFELARCLIKSHGFDGTTVAEAYYDWYKGNPTGIGGTVRSALQRYGETRNTFDGAWKHCGRRDFEYVDTVGAGTVMRVAPIGVYYSDEPDMLRWVTKQDAYITHRHLEAFAASLAVASLIAGIIRYKSDSKHNSPGISRMQAAQFMMNQLTVVSDSITARVLAQTTKELFDRPSDMADRFSGRFGNAWQIATTGIHCALHNWSNFNSGVMDAIKLGGDTDTRGAVTGAILGAVHGLEALQTFPNLDVLKNVEMLVETDRLLWARRRRAYD